MEETPSDAIHERQKQSDEEYEKKYEETLRIEKLLLKGYKFVSSKLIKRIETIASTLHESKETSFLRVLFPALDKFYEADTSEIRAADPSLWWKKYSPKVQTVLRSKKGFRCFQKEFLNDAVSWQEQKVTVEQRFWVLVSIDQSQDLIDKFLEATKSGNGKDISKRDYSYLDRFLDKDFMEKAIALREENGIPEFETWLREHFDPILNEAIKAKHSDSIAALGLSRMDDVATAKQQAGNGGEGAAKKNKDKTPKTLLVEIYGSAVLIYKQKRLEFGNRLGTAYGADKSALKETQAWIKETYKKTVSIRNLKEAMNRRIERRPMNKGKE